MSTWNPSLHPRGPGGRFTKSFARHMTTKDTHKVSSVQAGFKPRTFRTPDDAHGYLSGLSTVKTREPGQMDRMLAQLRAANMAARAGKSSPETQQLDAVMSPLPDDITVFRQVPAPKFGGATPQDLQGMLVQDAGYFPTTVAPPKPVPGTVDLTVDVPAGTKAAVAPDTSQVVLARETPMAVTEVQTRPDGTAAMHLVAVPEQTAAKASPAKAPAPPVKKALSFADIAAAAKKAPAKTTPPPPAAAPTPAPAKAAVKAPSVTPAKKAAAAKAAPTKKAIAKASPPKKTTAKKAPPTKKATSGSFDRRVSQALTGNQARNSTASIEDPSRPPPLSIPERQSLNSYRGNDYTRINERLRSGVAIQPLPAEDDESDDGPDAVDYWIGNIDSAMERATLSDEVATWRGAMDASRLFGNRINGNLTGMEWDETAYVSTSTDRSVSHDFASGALSDDGAAANPVLMRMVVPAGVGVVELSDERYESELLLQRGLRMRVVADRGRDAQGIRLIDVEVVPRGQ